MDYKEKYENGLECIQEILSGAGDSIKTSILRKRLQPFFPELNESEDERMFREIKRYIKEQGDKPTGLPNGTVAVSDMISWLEKQSKKQSADELMNVRQELYQSGYNDGYKHGYNHGQNNIAIALGKESIDALEHFVRSIGESGYASPYDNRTKLVYRLLEQLKQIVK